MLNILIVSEGDACRSRIAEALLLSFGRGMNIFTAGIAEAHRVSEIVAEVLEENGRECSCSKPVSIAERTHDSWDYVITLCREAEETLQSMSLQVNHWAHLYFDDPLATSYADESEFRDAVMALYQEMDHALYHFYRDELSERLMPRCTCGANTFCRCE